MRLNDDQTVVVRTLGDIKRVIQEFMPGKIEDVTVETDIKSDGKIYKVSAPANCDYKHMLIEGFGIVKKRLESMDKPEARDALNVDGHMWLDDLIKRRMDGVRDGLRVKWDIQEGTFYFNPFNGKLTQAE